MAGFLIFLKRWWPFFVIAFLAGLAGHLNNRAIHWHDQYGLSEQARKTDKATYKAEAAKAEADNKATVLATERKYAEIAANKEKTYNEAIKSANASVAAYVDRMRKQVGAAYPGGSNTASVSSLTVTPSSFDGTGTAPLIPVPESDLYICSANTIKAETWQVFWADIVANQPTENK